MRLLAWRLDVAHIDPLSKVLYTSGGNLKFHAGKLVTLRAVSGHRDTGPSECPGTVAYALLPALTKRIAATGLPKLYGPTVAGSVGGPVRFQARLSSSLAWTVSVVDRTGKPVASGRGVGDPRRLDMAVGGGSTGHLHLDDQRARDPDRDGHARRWFAAATSGEAVPDEPRGAAGRARSRGGRHRRDDDAQLHARAPAHVTGVVIGPSGTVVASVLDEDAPAGDQTFLWDAAALPDGRYRIELTASAVTSG